MTTTKSRYPYMLVFDEGDGALVTGPHNVTLTSNGSAVAADLGLRCRTERSVTRWAHAQVARRDASRDGYAILTAEEAVVIL
jgi:hypothetical protein